MGRTDDPDPAPVALVLQPVEVRPPPEQIVDLFDLHPAAVDAHLIVELGPPLRDRARPDLGRVPAASIASTTSSARPCPSGAMSNTCHVPSPTTGTRIPVAPKSLISIARILEW